MPGRGLRGASSVIGIILLVAITVIVASVVVTFGLSFTEGVSDPPPKGAFEFDYGNDTDTTGQNFPPGGSDQLNVIYTHGDSIPSSRVNVTVTGAKEIDQNGNVIGTNLQFRPNFAGGGNLFDGTEELTAGDSDTISDVDFVSVDGSGNLGAYRALDLSEATVRVYWVSDDGRNSAILAEWTGPSR